MSYHTGKGKCTDLMNESLTSASGKGSVTKMRIADLGLNKVQSMSSTADNNNQVWNSV
jgi:hypothetical protein